jgi:hypothetical protein
MHLNPFLLDSMVRASLSFLFALATLFALAILSEARPYTLAIEYRIVNAETDGWAKNFPPGAGRPPFNTMAIIDNEFASIYERWEIEQFEEGFSIRNVGTGFWLTARDGEVFGSSEFDQSDSKWYVESAGNGLFTIKVPNQDTVMTALHKKAGYPISIFLEPADGGFAQKWRFEHLG